MMRTLVRVLVIALALGPSAPADAYLKLGVRSGDRGLTARWASLPVRYFISDREVSGVSTDEFGAAVSRAFDVWQNVPTASITFDRVGFTAAPPLDEDGMTTLGFLDRSDADRVIATTSFLVETSTGTILEADIAFNAAVPWSVAPTGEPGRFDVESIAVHEIGHLLGLGHSAIGETELRADGSRRLVAAETIMFPIAFSPGSVVGRTLTPDDVAGVSDLYPAGDFRQRTGSVRGRVTKGGQGVLGAHVVAFNLETGILVGNFTLDSSGTYVIAGLDPGAYVLRVEPLDDGDLESFLGEAGSVDLDFRVAFSQKIVVVPLGGTADADVQVVAK